METETGTQAPDVKWNVSYNGSAETLTFIITNGSYVLDDGPAVDHVRIMQARRDGGYDDASPVATIGNQSVRMNTSYWYNQSGGVSFQKDVPSEGDRITVFADGGDADGDGIAGIEERDEVGFIVYYTDGRYVGEIGVDIRNGSARKTDTPPPTDGT